MTALSSAPSAVEATALPALLAALDQTVLVVQPDGRVRYDHIPDPAIARSAPADGAGLALDQALPPPLPEKLRPMLAEAQASGFPQRDTVSAVVYDGSERQLDVRASAMADGSVLVLLRDDTARAIAAHELRAAVSRAEAGDVAKSLFLAAVSHELRTPMSSIIGYNELLLEGRLTDEQRDYAGNIMEAAQTLMGTLNDIIDFATVEREGQTIRYEKLDLEALISDLVSQFRHRAAANDVAVSMAIDPALPGVVLSDPVRLQQVLVRLMDNAVKFTRQGSIRIEAAAMEPPGQPPVLVFAIIDTGPGIDLDMQPYLFTRFFQPDLGAARRYGGTGMGLALCKRLIDQMGGEIGVDSAPGRGSSFWLSVPLIPA